VSLPDWQDSDLQAAAPTLDYWANVYGLDRALVYGLVSQESSFRPLAFLMDRNGGSFGLTQISLPTATMLGYAGDGAGLYDPDTNVQFGLLYLRNQIDKYGDEGQALSAYNSGSPTGSSAGNAYAAAVENRAFYFQDLWGVSSGAGGSFDVSGGSVGTPSLAAFGIVAAMGLAYVAWKSS
jgi:soluble lytic murein transglycosylase-like protein